MRRLPFIVPTGFAGGRTWHRVDPGEGPPVAAVSQGRALHHS